MCCCESRIPFVRYDPAAGTAPTAAGKAGGALPPAPDAPPRVDLFGTYNACESVFLVLLPTAVDAAALPAARFPGTTAFPCPGGFSPPAFVLVERAPEFACALMEIQTVAQRERRGRPGRAVRVNELIEIHAHANPSRVPMLHFRTIRTMKPGRATRDFR